MSSGPRRRDVLRAAAALGMTACSGASTSAPADAADAGTDATTAHDARTADAPTADARTADALAADTTGADAAAQCTTTAPNIEGPFYLPDIPVRSDLDLYGEEAPRIHLVGRVLDAACQPIAGATLHVWHADAAGGYDTSSDERRYYGQQITDGDGAYELSTIEPGRYLNGAEYRPAHLHVKVYVGGVEQLTTQLYFDGDPYNDVDPFIDRSLIVRYENGEGQFDFTVPG